MNKLLSKSKHPKLWMLFKIFGHKVRQYTAFGTDEVYFVQERRILWWKKSFINERMTRGRK